MCFGNINITNSFLSISIFRHFKVYNNNFIIIIIIIIIIIMIIIIIIIIIGDPGSVESLKLKSFLTVPSAPTTIGTTFLFLFQHLDISIRRSGYLHIFSNVFDTMLVSDGTEVSTRVHSLFFSSLTTMSGLFACMFLSVCIWLSYSTVSSFFLSLFEFRVRTTYF